MNFRNWSDVGNFPGVWEFTSRHAFVEEFGQPFWSDVIVIGLHTLTFCVHCTRMKKDSADAIEILQKLHHIASHFIRKHVFIKLPSFQFRHLPDGLVARIPGRPGFNSRSGNFVKHHLIERRSWHCCKSAWMCDFLGQTFFAISTDFQRVSVFYWTGFFH